MLKNLTVKTSPQMGLFQAFVAFFGTFMDKTGAKMAHYKHRFLHSQMVAADRSTCAMPPPLPFGVCFLRKWEAPHLPMHANWPHCLITHLQPATHNLLCIARVHKAHKDVARGQKSRGTYPSLPRIHPPAAPV